MSISCLKEFRKFYVRTNWRPSSLYIINNNVPAINKFHQHTVCFQEAEISVDDDMPLSNMRNPYKKDGRKCVLCKYKIKLDYKNTKLLSQFVSPYTGRIYDKHITGLCQQQQDIVKQTIKKAQSYGFMPVYLKEPKFLKDPLLFDPFKPERPHPY